MNEADVCKVIKYLSVMKSINKSCILVALSKLMCTH